jgi:hypothetical protein
MGGCGWRTMQNCISKLLNIEITIEDIMKNLEKKIIVLIKIIMDI